MDNIWQNASPIPTGLTAAEVQSRVAQGLVNETEDTGGKTVGEIIKSNVLTYFNLIFFIIAIVLCCVGSYRNLTFVPLVLANTLIGIVQELRARHILNKMSLLNAPHALAVRDGIEQKLDADELVQDDVIILSACDQICVDAVGLSGSV